MVDNIRNSFVIREGVGRSQSAGGDFVTEIQVSSTKASKVRWDWIELSGLVMVVPAGCNLEMADIMVLMVNNHIMGEVPLPCPHPYNGLSSVAEYHALEIP